MNSAAKVSTTDGQIGSAKTDHFWLASYPKSGNTWLRLFLENMLRPSRDTVDINRISVGEVACDRQWVERGLGFDISDLSHDEVDSLRPYAYRWHFNNLIQPSQANSRFHKIHDAYQYLPDGEPFISQNAASGVVYILRNPLDVVVSAANHANMTLDQTISKLCNANLAFGNSTKTIEPQLRLFIGSWSALVSSWLNADTNTLVVRYEDMKSNPSVTFHSIADFLKLSSDPMEVDNALKQCQFAKIQQQENEQGFVEKPNSAKIFFRKGIVGDWKNHLNQQQVQTIIENHYPVMQRAGYLDQHGAPLVTPQAMRF